jgi:hypothetical protein
LKPETFVIADLGEVCSRIHGLYQF